MRLVVDCPPLPEPAYVDRDMWEKIVLNLLSNAFKYTLEGEITVSLRRGGRRRRAPRAATRGPGSRRTSCPMLFERFHRVEGARGRTHEGTGIGLALVQELARLHGGRVEVASMFGDGTTFTVTIPPGRDHLPADRIGGHATLGLDGDGSDALRRGGAPMAAADRAVRAVGRTARVGPRRHVATRRPARSRPAPSGRASSLADDNADMRDYVSPPAGRAL